MGTPAPDDRFQDPEWRKQRAIAAGQAGGRARTTTTYLLARLADRAADLTAEEVAKLTDIINANVHARAFSAGDQ